MGEYTKGPWEINTGEKSNGEIDEDLAYSITQVDGSQWDVAAVWKDCDFPKGNAQLIASAPELLNALQQMTDYLIESHADEIANNHYGDEQKNCSYCRTIRLSRAAIAKATGL